MSDDEEQIASVSSLRSRFESLQTGEKRSSVALNVPETPIVAQRTGSHIDPFTHSSSSSVRSRASLDVQRPSLERLTGSNGSSLKPPPEMPAERPSGARRRPLSYGHFTSTPPKPAKMTPTLKIESPKSPSPRTEISGQRSPMPQSLMSPRPGQASRSISPNSRRPPPPPPPPARPTKMNGNRQSIILNSGATTPVTATTPRHDFPLEAAFQSEHYSAETPRTERPKIPPAVPSKRPDMGLSVSGRTGDGTRRSPFSTPPASHNNSPEHSDDNRDRSIPRKISSGPINYPPPPHPPTIPATRQYTPTPEKSSWEQRHGRPRPQSQLVVGTPEIYRPRRSFEEPPPIRNRPTYPEHTEANRPSLPPRPPNLLVKSQSVRGRSHSPTRATPAPPPPPESRPHQPVQSQPPPQQQQQQFLPPPPRRGTSTVNSKSPARVDHPPIGVQHTGGYGNHGGHLKAPPQPQEYYGGSDSSGEEQQQDGVSLSEYPDASQANRRKPHFKAGIPEMKCKSDVNLFAVCGQYVCVASNTTRVWDVTTGDCIMTLHHSEGTRITALAFKPSARLEDEGARIWLGTSHGELMEIDIATNRTVESRASAHTKKEIVRIHRKGYEMWTIDDSGKLQMWGAGSKEAPNLRNAPLTHRITNKFTFSMVVGNQLWVTSGKMIYVYEPTVDSRIQFNVTARPISANKPAGDITCGATLSGDPDKVYFGHSDGKVSIFSRSQLACLDVVSVSLYKINSLAGVGSYLWAGFRTGMMYVYDVKSRPWRVTKDWQAHDAPIVEVVADRSSIWKIDRLQVISLGTDNFFRIWDGMLEEDWLEGEMQSVERDFCSFRDLNALVCTWNAGACKPQDMLKSADDATFLENLLTSSGTPDILVFGFQELVDLEDKKIQAKSIGSILKKKKKHKEKDLQQDMSHQYRAWQEALTRATQDYMPRDTRYYLLHAANLVGLFTCIFVKESQRNTIRGVSASTIKRGLGGLHGNKGALVLRFLIDDSSLCFINCHLAAGQSHTSHRNNDIAAILEASALPAESNLDARADIFVGGGDGSMILDHEICILNGDLNYRIDMHRELAIQRIRNNDLAPLLEKDQLLSERRRNPAFRLRAFGEEKITFAPTYKYDVASDQYDTSEKKRSPAWCDRLLYRGIADRVVQHDYRRWEVRTSDHRPVSGLFTLQVKTVDPHKRAVVWERSLKKYEKVKRKSVYDAKLDFLVNVYEYGAEEATQTLGNRQRDERDLGEAVHILQQQRTGQGL